MVKKKIYQTIDEARNGLFSYIDMFYHHSYLEGISPKAFEHALNSEL
jgi:hypothetical protein